MSDETGVENAIEGLMIEDPETGERFVRETGKDTTESPSQPTEKSAAEGEGGGDEIRYEVVWKKSNRWAREGARKFYDDQFGDAMGDKAKQQRLDALCVVAHVDDEIVAVSTVAPNPSQALWVNVAWFLCFVHPDHRRKGVATNLVRRAKVAVEEWAKSNQTDNPKENILAFGVRCQKSTIGAAGAKPYWPDTGLALAGYTPENLQVRLVWFDHARVEY